jgi:UDP-glucose 4-epimerase
VLVTGGGGFIGSHLTELLLARGDEVTVVDDFSTGRRENVETVRRHAPASPNYRVIEGRSSDVLPTLSAGDFDRIYHLAAAVGVRLVVERPIHTIETNVHETSAVLRFAAAARVPILIASYSRWCYAASKALDEYLALAYQREHGLPAVVVRFFNTVGPRQVGEYGMVLPRFVEAALDGRDLEVHGDGTQSRCFCDVRDVVRALPAMLETVSCVGRVFNVGRDESISIADLAALVIRTLGSRSAVRFVPYEAAFAAGFDDLKVRQPDLSRIREAIGFAPTIPLSQTILDLAAEIAARPRDAQREAPCRN